MDLVDQHEADKRVQAIIKGLNWKAPVFTISAMKADGCKELTFAIMDHVEKQRAAASSLAASAVTDLETP
jgi:GTP-binding protein